MPRPSALGASGLRSGLRIPDLVLRRWRDHRNSGLFHRLGHFRPRRRDCRGMAILQDKQLKLEAFESLCH